MTTTLIVEENVSFEKREAGGDFVYAVSSSVGYRTPRSAALRKGLQWFLFLATCGMILIAVGEATTSVIAGVGLACVYSGLLVLLIFIYAYGLRTGDYLMRPRYAILSMVALVGLTATSIIAAIEILLKRGS